MVDGAYIRQWIHLRYKACQFKRYMSESDMSVRLLLTHCTPPRQCRPHFRQPVPAHHFQGDVVMVSS